MPKALKYESYSLISGLAQGTDEQTFTKLLLNRVENLRYIKEDALISIDSYENLGKDSSKPDNEYIQLKSFRNTLLAFTYNEIFRFNEQDRASKKYTFDKIGDYLNADISTHLISSISEDILDPALEINYPKAYILYRTGNKIVFSRFDLKTGSFEFTREWTSDLKNFKIAVNKLIVDTAPNGVTLFAHDDSFNELSIDPFNPTATWTQTGDTQTLGALRDVDWAGNSVLIAERTIYNIKVWGRFDYEGKTFIVIWSPEDGYYIVDTTNGKPVGKIGILNSPKISDDYYMVPGNIVVQDDDIYFPVLLSDSPEPGVGIGTITYPVGLYIIHLKIDKKFPQFKAYEYGNGLLMSGPIIQNYDGSEFSEFNFCQRLGSIERVTPPERKIHETEVVLDFKSSDQRTFMTGEIQLQTTAVKGGRVSYSTGDLAVGTSFRRSTGGSRLRTRSYTFSSGDVDLNSDDTVVRYDDDRRRIISFLDAYSGGDAEDSDFEVTKLEVTIATGSIELRMNGSGYSGLNNIFGVANTPVWLIAANQESDISEGRCIVWYLTELGTGSINIDDNFDGAPIYNGVDTIDTDLRFFVLATGYSQQVADPGAISSSVTRVMDGDDNSEYQVKVTQTQTTTEFEITRDGEDPPEAGFFSSAVIQQGSNSETYTFSGAMVSVSGNVRKYIVPKGALTLSANPTDYVISLTGGVGGGRGEWENRFDESILNRDFENSSVRINRVRLNAEANELSVEFNNLSQFNDLFSGRKSYATLEIQDDNSGAIDAIYLFSDAVDEDGNTKKFDIGSIGRAGIPVGPLIVGDSSLEPADRRVKITFWSLSNADQDLGFLPVYQYQYSGYFKWRDPFGKEHISALANPLLVVQFGQVGAQRRNPDGSLKNSVVQNVLKFKNLNLTAKKNVSFVLLRSDSNQTSGDYLYRIVKEVPVNLGDEFIEITDDVHQDMVRGAVLSSNYDSIIQPSGARSIAVGRWNRIFLGGIIGVENGLLISNFLSNNAVDIFSFRAEAGVDIIRRFDHKILNLERLDSNLIVFTEKAILNIQVETLNPHLIQQSESNYATQKEGIVPWVKGIAYINDKGMQFLGRDFNCYWMSKNIIDTVETSPIPIDSEVGFDPGSEKIVDAKVSHKDREVRFRLADKETNEDRGYLSFNTEYLTWTREKNILGPEEEILGERFKIDREANLHVSVIGRDRQVDKKLHILETGWLNYKDAKKSALVRNIDFIGNFGDFAPLRGADPEDTGFLVQIWYNDNENALPEYHKVVSLPSSGARKLARISIKQQKNFSIKIRLTIFSNVVKLSAIGFQIRSQTAGAKVGRQQTF